MYIAFFDSGVGGITVLKQSLSVLPHEDYFYYGDTSHVPYGVKPKEQVKQFVLESITSIIPFGIKALVVACNAATSIAINDLRKQFSFPVIGMEPAVKVAVDSCKNKRILVLSTVLTLKEEKFNNLVSKLDKYCKIDTLPLSELVHYAENFNFKEEEISAYFREKFISFNLEDYGAVVLGCTHFIYYKNILQKILPKHVLIVDGNNGTINQLSNVLKKNKLEAKENKAEILLYFSGVKNLKRNAEIKKIIHEEASNYKIIDNIEI